MFASLHHAHNKNTSKLTKEKILKEGSITWYQLQDFETLSIEVTHTINYASCFARILLIEVVCC
jgi:hypothetical protein